MLNVTNVHKSFGDNEVLRGVSFDIKNGDVIAGQVKQRCFDVLSFLKKRIKDIYRSETLRLICILHPDKRYMRSGSIHPSFFKTTTFLITKMLWTMWPWD